MTSGLVDWGRWAAWLAGETVGVIALAALLAGCLRSARARCAVWRSSLLATGLLWAGEMAGARPVLQRWWPEEPARREVRVRLLDGRERGGVTGAVPSVSGRGATADRWTWWPGVLWFGGTLVSLGPVVLGQVAVRRRRRAARPVEAATAAVVARLARELGLRTVEVEAWPGVRGPVAFGVVRRGVALPEDFPTRFPAVQREAMLAHELAHLVARDPAWLLLARVIGALAWWHPAVAWARRRLEEEMEAAADEASVLVPAGRLALAEALVTFGRDLGTPGVERGLGVAGAGRESSLARRVKRLLAPATPWRAVSRWQALGPGAIAVMAVSLVLVVAWPGSAVEPPGPRMLQALNSRWGGVDVPATVEAPGGGAAVPGTNGPPAPAPTGAEADIVTLEVQLFEVPERTSGVAGTSTAQDLDALFVDRRPAGAAAPSGFAAGRRPAAGPPPASHYRVDVARTEGQQVGLQATEVAAWNRRMDREPGIVRIAAPRVQTFSGQHARVSVLEQRNLVAGVEARDGTETNAATINYRTEPVGLGPVVDLVPTRIEAGWNLAVVAQMTEFVGYDDPGGFVVEARAAGGEGEPIRGVQPLPRLRVREAVAEGRLVPGESLLVRGPVAEQIVRTKGTLFRKSRTDIQRTRLYLLVSVR